MLLSLATDKHAGAAPLIEELRAGHKGRGIPWMVVLDAERNELVTSDGPKGNVGCPVDPDEIAWFKTMLERSRQRLTDAELDAIEKANREFAERILKK